MHLYRNRIILATITLILFGNFLPWPAATGLDDPNGLNNVVIGISAIPDNPDVGEFAGFSFSLSNRGNSSVSFDYNITVEGMVVRSGQGAALELYETKEYFTGFGWAFDRPGTYQVRMTLTEASGTGKIEAMKNITVNPDKSFFRWRSGTLDALRVLFRTEPCDSQVGEFIFVSLLNTGKTDLIVNYELFGGFGHCIGNGSGIAVSRDPSNWTCGLNAYWAADPTGNGMYPIGINISDVNGTGRLVEYWVSTVAEFNGNGTGPLCGVVMVQPEAEIGEIVPVRALVANVGDNVLEDVQYTITSGDGNVLARGGTGSLLPRVMLQNRSSIITELEVNWTPLSSGIYFVGINASDKNGSAFLSAGIEVTVSGPGKGRLAAVIDVDSASLDLGGNFPVSCILRNIGYGPLYNVRYLITTSSGDLLRKGTVGDLSPGTFCQSMPASMVVINTTWTPDEKGTYEIRINASDENQTSFVTSHVTKTVRAPNAAVNVAFSPLALEIHPGAFGNATVSVHYMGGLMSNVLYYTSSSSIANLSVNFIETTAKNCSVRTKSREIHVFMHHQGDFNISFLVPPSTPAGSYDIFISVRSYRENLTSTASMKLEVKPAPVDVVETAPSGPQPIAAFAGFAVAAMVGLVALALVCSTEFGLVALLSLFIPLYSKIHKDEVLDQFTRGKIQGYITAYPGEHYNSIKTQLGLNNGVLAYHLRVLEREGYVTSLRDGVYKRFYPKETPLPKKRGQFSAIQEMIIENIRDEPGITQDGLARKMKVSNQVIYYHIRNLMAARAIRVEKVGKETHCYLSDSDNPGSYAGLSF